MAELFSVLDFMKNMRKKEQKGSKGCMLELKNIKKDYPAGVLDTETSVQVMDILKEIAKDRLVVMVTHNPDLAERYSTRIIRMLDGEITDDSAPLTQEEENREHLKEKSKTENKKLPSMSFATSFGLSLKNLLTKKDARSLLHLRAVSGS